jgi:succinoglycan biosynthesis transport protein ExoP
MHQIGNERSARIAEPGLSGSSELTALVDLVLGLLRRQYLLILICLALALAGGVAYLFVAPPQYTASALVMMDSRTGQFSPERSIVGDTALNSPWIESQFSIIRSESLLESVAKKLKLGSDPQFVDPESPLRRLIFGPAEQDKTETDADRLRRAVAVVDKNLNVERVGISYVIEIRVRTSDPHRAAEIANGIADAYLSDLVAARSQASRRASDWLQDRLQKLREQSAAAERAVVEFKSKNNIVAAEGKLISDQQLSDLTARLAAARAKTGEAEARLSQIETVLKLERPDTTINAVADSLNNPIITQLRTKYLEEKNREAQWAALYGSKHAAVTKLRNQLHDLRNSIQSELRRIAESYRNEYAVAQNQQLKLEEQFKGLIEKSQLANQAQITLRTLESNAQSLRALYNNFLQRHAESQQSFPSSEGRVISAAQPPGSKSHPRASLVTVIAAFGGLALGFGLGLLRELMDRVFRTSGQVQAAVGAQCVAMVPRLPTRATRSSRIERGPAKAVPRLTWCDDTSVASTVINSPLSPFAEAIRSIKLAADLGSGRTSGKIIGLVSSLPGEGKTTVATALGEVVAQSGARVVLVDCDLRNPSLSRSLAPKAKTGLLDVVFGNERLEDTIWTDARTGMGFIPSVVGSHLPHTSEILASQATKDIFDRLRAKYDYVIVDLSPLSAGVDARLTTAFIDAYVLVVKWGQTTIDVVRYALHSAQGVQDNLLGVVLNHVDFKRLASYDGHGAKHYYHDYTVRGRG